jgi:hypothetical protein
LKARVFAELSSFKEVAALKDDILCPENRRFLPCCSEQRGLMLIDTRCTVRIELVAWNDRVIVLDASSYSILVGILSRALLGA